MATNKKRLTVYLPRELIREMRMLTAQREVSASLFVETLVASAIKRAGPRPLPEI